MYQKIKNKFKANPTLFYACSIVASWAGVGSLMNFRTLATSKGATAAIIWAVFNSLSCILFDRPAYHAEQSDVLLHRLFDHVPNVDADEWHL